MKKKSKPIQLTILNPFYMQLEKITYKFSNQIDVYQVLFIPLQDNSYTVWIMQHSIATVLLKKDIKNIYPSQDFALELLNQTIAKYA